MQIFTPAITSHKALHYVHLHAAYKILLSPLLIHIREEIYIFLSGSCIKCMERRVLKRAPTSAKMNKISDSFSGYRDRERERERERVMQSEWLVLLAESVHSHLCNIKSH